MLQDKLLSVNSLLRKRIADLGFVESATLIGRPVQERTIERTLDLDHVLIVPGLDLEKYRKVERVFEELQNEASQNIDIQYAVFDGPMKPHSERENEVFFHVVLHTPETYKQSPLLLVKNSWQFEMPFLGKSLRGYQSFPKGVTREMLFSSGLGIDSLVKMVATDSSLYCGWDVRERVVEPKVGEKQFYGLDERLELYYYAILRAASNTIRFFTGNNREGIGLQMCANFQRYFGDFAHAGLPREVYDNKRLLRNKVLVLSSRFVSQYQQKALGFLKELREYVEKVR